MKDKIYNVALLSNFTVKGLDKCLKESAKQYDIAINVYNGEYGQWQQEILGGKLYVFSPDIIYLILDLAGQDESMAIIDQLTSKTQAKIIVSNAVNDYLNVSQALDINSRLDKKYQGDSQVHVFDFDGWLGSIGKNEYWNTKYRYLADMRLSPDALPMLANELVGYLVPLAGKTKKCLVLDLDNTLWGGIIGEDGLGGIKLAPGGEGASYYDFQKLIKTMSERGIILAINSSNNQTDVDEVFAKHKYMLLKEGDFAAARINWDNKVKNMEELAQELNIGLDSFVFVDDDPRNCELIKKALPQVTALDLPQDSADYGKALLAYKGFSAFGVTEEDKKRAQMYGHEKKRRQEQAQTVDLESFLRGLNLEITIREASEHDIARVAQLTQKTNQFNLTTRRYQEEDIRQFIKNRDKLWILEATDKFGDYGTTGLIIAKNAGQSWQIDTFLLSCRVLGKRIEEQFFGRILQELKEIDDKQATAEYIATSKNSQVKDFYKKFGFQKIKSSADIDTWQYDLRSYQFKPLDFIKVEI